jgi:hypothetical protein
MHYSRVSVNGSADFAEEACRLKPTDADTHRGGRSLQPDSIQPYIKISTRPDFSASFISVSPTPLVLIRESSGVATGTAEHKTSSKKILIVVPLFT